MKTIDLTKTVTEDISLWPGTPKPQFHTICNYGRDGFKETQLELTSHTGTHMDAPSHIFRDGRTLDNFPAEHFFGKALVIDCRAVKAGECIGIEYVESVKEMADKAEFLLFWTGWEYESPGISLETAKYAVVSGKKGVGIDTMSIDRTDRAELLVHKKLLVTNQIVIIENLCNLELAGSRLIDFWALPLKYEGADGAPVRAIACIGEGERV